MTLSWTHKEKRAGKVPNLFERLKLIMNCHTIRHGCLVVEDELKTSQRGISKSSVNNALSNAQFMCLHPRLLESLRDPILTINFRIYWLNTTLTSDVTLFVFMRYEILHLKVIAAQDCRNSIVQNPISVDRCILK